MASERTSGRFICNDTEMIRKLKEDVICRKTDMFIEEIRQYGCDDGSHHRHSGRRGCTMEKLIEISGLSKAYGKKQALHNVDMVFEEGQIIGLLGPNGSGKTTLLKVMTGLLKDYDGVVKIDGTCIGAETKAMVSYLPDEPYFSDWMKVKDALAIFVDMYADFDLDKCLTIMRRFQIDDGMRIKTMSKGTKEKFQLALVMSRKEIIVLDEPIGGVDPAAREVILDTILEIILREDDTLLQRI